MPLMPPEEKKAFALLPEGPDRFWPFALVVGLFLLVIIVKAVLILIFLPDPAAIPLGFTFFLFVLQAAILTLPLIFIIKNHFHCPLSALGFRRAPLLRVIGIGLLAGVLIRILSIPVGRFFAWLYDLIFGQPQETQSIMQSLAGAGALGEKLMLVFLITVLAPIWEEIFCRSFLYAYLRKYLGPLWGIIIAGFIFGLIHFEWALIPPLALTGMALCWLYEKYNNIWINILAHAVFNGISVALLFFVQAQAA